MGGGGRTALTVAGKLSRINGGRGGPGGGVIGCIKSVSLPEHHISTTSTSPNRTSSRNVSVAANEDGGGGNTAVLLSDSSLHRSASWEIDDWEFAGVEEEMNPMPRVVFGRVPSFEEAEEATSQLKQALDRVYMDSTDKLNESIPVKESTPSVDYGYGCTETRSCITSSPSLVARTSIPRPVFQAFSLLQTSPECQDAVASIASDKTVWEAVMQNPKVQDFIKSRQASAVLTDMDDMEDSKDAFLDDEKASDCVGSEVDEKNHDKDATTNGFTEFMLKIKVALSDMSSNLYGIVLSIIGGPTEENVSLNSKGAATATANTDKSIAASLMALAVMAIMVIVLKRA